MKTMKTRRLDTKIYSILILSLMLIYLFIYRFIILEYCIKYEEFITSSFYIILMTITIILIGYRVNKIEKINDSKIIFLISSLLLYFALIYCIGIFKGFLQNAYSLRIKQVFFNILCPFINLVCVEMIRYMLLCSNKKSKSFYIVCMIIFTFIEIIFNFNFYNLHTIDGIFELICLLIVKSFMDNLLLGYMSINSGLKSCIIYKSLTSLYLFIVPIIPDLGLLLGTLIEVIFPFVLWVYISKIVSEEYEASPNKFNTKNNTLINNFILYTTLLIFIIITGLTPIKVKTIGSASMSPKINIGDIVVINALAKNIKAGDVIAFRYNGMIIVHRVYEIDDNADGEKRFITKGDFNNEIDLFHTEEKDIVGKVIFNIPYLGYPSIFITNLIGGH